ncbi:TcpQ domain-containing protein [Vibrio splendidus]
MNTNKKTKIALLISLMSIAPNALSALYVSPILRDSVHISEPQEFTASDAKNHNNAHLNKLVTNQSGSTSATNVSNGNKGQMAGVSEASKEPSLRSISGTSDIHGDFVMSSAPKVEETPFAYGENVPLFIALKNIVPQIDSWFVNIDDGLKNQPLNWKGAGSNWEEVLATIGKQNKLFITINGPDRSIGISKNAKISKYMAFPVPKVWKADAGDTIRKTVIKWAKKSGYTVQWDNQLDTDYVIGHSAIFTGDFVDKKGVVYDLLLTTKNEKVSLQSKLYTGNSVVHVFAAGYDQEVRF